MKWVRKPNYRSESKTGEEVIQQKNSLKQLVQDRVFDSLISLAMAFQKEGGAT